MLRNKGNGNQKYNDVPSRPLQNVYHSNNKEQQQIVQEGGEKTLLFAADGVGLATAETNMKLQKISGKLNHHVIQLY